MALISKDEYTRRENSAARRMARNAEIDTLTAEQHDTLAWLCAIRHDVHSSRPGSLFYSSWADYRRCWDLVDTENHDNEIISRIRSANLPSLRWECNGAYYADDADWNDCEIEDPDHPGEWFPEVLDENDTRYPLKREAALLETVDLIEAWNTAIESYLRDIDEKHGTHYAPSGAYRL